MQKKCHFVLFPPLYKLQKFFPGVAMATSYALALEAKSLLTQISERAITTLNATEKMIMLVQSNIL